MKDRFHALDGLRAVAATLVVVHHLAIGALAQELYKGGREFLGNLVGSITASGVELFFVLSAIVLARPYVRNERPFNLSSYLVRRVQRLFPPYLAAWLLAGAAIYLASRYPTWWTAGSKLPEFSWSTWLSQVGIIYFGQDNYNFAWWSLTVEVAFYLILPVLIPVFSRLSVQALHVSWVVSALLAILLPSAVAVPSVVESLATYASCFCAGLVLARVTPSLRASTALIVFGVIWVFLASQYPVLNVHLGWGAVYFGLVAWAMTPRTIWARVLSSYGLVWLGERSYSLFLVHFSVIGLVSHATSYVVSSKSLSYYLLTRSISLVLILVVTILVFHLVERRFAHGLVTANHLLPYPKA